MKRLLCIVSSMDTGGAETFLMKMYRQIDKTEYQMDFIAASEKEGFYDEEIRSLGGKIYTIPLHTQKPFRALAQVRRIVRENRYDNVLKLCGSPLSGIPDLLAAKWGGAKHLCARSCIGAMKESKSKRAMNAFFRPILRALCDKMLAPSDVAAEYTFGRKAVKKNRVVFLHNAVDLDHFCYRPEVRKTLREELGVGEDTMVIGHVGRFTKQKNHTFLLEIFQLIRSKRKSKLVLIGTGEREKEIQAKIEDFGIGEDVIFLGVKSNVNEWYSAFDVFALPSLYEGMPNTVIEAQATGLPCVISNSITRQVAITDLVRFLSLHQPEKWARVILDLEREDRVKKAQALCGSPYDIRQESKRFIEQLYR